MTTKKYLKTLLLILEPASQPNFPKEDLKAFIHWIEVGKEVEFAQYKCNVLTTQKDDHKEGWLYRRITT